MTTEDELRARIKARKDAEDHIREYIAKVSLTYTPEQMAGVKRAVTLIALELSPDVVGKGDGLSAMTKQESDNFEDEDIGYGQYMGTCRGAVPEWYMDLAIKSAEQLVRYSRSEAWLRRG